MRPIKICDNLYWVGAIDWNVRNFHGHTYTVNNGTTYNAYLIIDEKVALVDTVLGAFKGEMIERIREIVPIDRIDYIIANHVEPDHSGALPSVLGLCPDAKVYGSAKCKDGLEKHYPGKRDFNIVKSGDKLSLGKRDLSFIEAPMLHWPDSMFTYIEKDALLLPNDAFGQHLASSGRFDDEIDNYLLMQEARKYYANILWPFSGLVVKKIEQIVKMGIPIKMIAPSHGVIWRNNPKQIIDAYSKWGNNTASYRVVVAYETMWGSTEKMAKAISQGIMDSGVTVKFYDINKSDKSEIITDMLESKGYMLGSSTHDNSVLPNIAGFLEFFKGMKPKNRIGGAFGSYGWAGGSVPFIEKVMGEAGVKMPLGSVAIKYVPNIEEINQCYEYGVNFAKAIKEG